MARACPRAAGYDLQWADTASLRLLTYLAPEIAHLRLFRLAFYDCDCPNRKAFKMRVLAFLGATTRTRTALTDFFPPDSFSRLPHDRDYLGTLAHLAVAAVESDSVEHARALMPLLKRYQHRFVADLTVHCEGSVDHFWGLLARYLDLDAEAIAAFERAFEANERAGLKARAARSLDELARLLMASADAKQRTRGEGLWRQATERWNALGYMPARQPHERRDRNSILVADV